jgi:aconitase A
MTNEPTDVNDAIEQYRRTCSVIFGKTSSSQIRYLQALDVQQSLLTSCDGTIAKQIIWLEDLLETKNHDKSKTWSEMILEPFLRSYSAAVEGSMAMILFRMILLAINSKVIRK